MASSACAEPCHAPQYLPELLSGDCQNTAADVFFQYLHLLLDFRGAKVAVRKPPVNPNF